LKRYQTEKDNNIAHSIEAAKSEKERKIAFEKLAKLVCEHLSPIVTGKKLICEKYQDLTDIVTKLTDLTSTLEELRTQINADDKTLRESLIQLERKRQQSEQMAINRLKEEIEKLEESMKILQIENEELQIKRAAAEAEHENLKNWIKRKQTNDSEFKITDIQNENLQFPKKEVKLRHQKSSHDLTSENIQTDAQGYKPTHNEESTADLESQRIVQGQRSIQGQKSNDLYRFEQSENSLTSNKKFSSSDNKEMDEMAQNEEFMAEQNKCESDQGEVTTTTQSFGIHHTRVVQHHTSSDCVETEYTSVSRSTSALSQRKSSLTDSTISDNMNRISENRNDNMIACNNKNVHIHHKRYENCTINIKYKIING